MGEFKSFALVYADGVQKQLQVSAAKTSTFQTNTTTDCRFWQYFVITANVTAVSGTSPTLDLQLQISQDNSTWVGVDSVQVAQITATGHYSIMVKGPINGYQFMRVNGAVAGTSPSFTLSMQFYAYGPYATVA